MDKVQEYQRRAAECRSLAAMGSSAETGAHYEYLAVMWDKLAEERLAFFVTPPEVVVPAAITSP
jgi:hypothetical protein